MSYFVFRALSFFYCSLEINELNHHTAAMEFYFVVCIYLSRHWTIGFSSALSNGLYFYLNSIDKIKNQTEKWDAACDKMFIVKKPSPLNLSKSINGNRLVNVFINWQNCTFYASFIAANFFGSCKWNFTLCTVRMMNLIDLWWKRKRTNVNWHLIDNS